MPGLGCFQIRTGSALDKLNNLPDKVVAHTSIRLSSADVAEAAVAPNMSPAVAKVAQILAPGGICLIHSSGRTF